MEDEEFDIKPEDVLEEVKFTIDKNAFKGPFRCCGLLTKRVAKKTRWRGLSFNYEVWECEKCGEEYLDIKQAKHFEKFWILKMLLEDNAISMDRKVNFDGKTYFIRFPKDITKSWSRKSKAEINVISPQSFLVEIKAA